MPDPTSHETAPHKVAVVGAGLSGALLAALVARRGMDVTLYERRPDPRSAGAERGRSINLALSERGLAAAGRIGLREKLLDQALPMRGRIIHASTADGAPSFRPYSADGTQSINSISRGDLNIVLLDAADATPGVTIKFDHRLVDIDLDAGEIEFEHNGETSTERASIILAADGAYSAARQTITHSTGFTYSQDYLEHAYREMVIPARDGDYALDPGALHIWPRGESMMIALPNLDKSFTCTLFWPRQRFDALQTDEQILGYFRETYPDAVDLMPTVLEDFRTNPTGSLLTVRCWPWVRSGSAATLALVGDAAHAIVPFYGQGANCAMEDCAEIDDCLAEFGNDWPAVLGAYQDRRKANADAIAEMALDNFIEMRDSVNSYAFRAEVATQHAIERALGKRYRSRYELVSFSTIPYSEIAGRLKRQNRLVGGAVAGSALVAGVLARALFRRGRD